MFARAINAYAISLLILSPWLSINPAIAGEVANSAQRARMAAQMYPGTLEFYVAKGPPNACGPGCSEWIAVQGMMDFGSGNRFKEFLNSKRRRSLPVFLHSSGGVSNDAFDIGRLLRKYKMAAGIARTFPTECPQRPSDGCDPLIKSGQVIPARIQFDGAHCNSACTYAFVGASRRTVAPDAIVAVHAPRSDPGLTKQHFEKYPNAKQLSSAENLRFRRKYMIEMGINPDFVDFTFKINSADLYILNRDEISRFKLELHDGVQ